MYQIAYPMNKFTFVLILFLLASCKDESPTDGEQIGNTLKALVNKHNIKTADVYIGNYQAHKDVAFSIEGSFLKVEASSSVTQYFNLTDLVTFNVNQAGSQGNTFDFLFTL